MRLAVMVLFCLLTFALQARAQDGPGASVEMPVTVTIIDFQTTRKICGADDPPSWCPAHLLNPAPVTLVNMAALPISDIKSRTAALEREERGKRQKLLE